MNNDLHTPEHLFTFRRMEEPLPYLQYLRQQQQNDLLISAYGHLMTISRIFFHSEYHRPSLRYVGSVI